MPKNEIGKLTRRYIFNVLFWPVEEDGAFVRPYREPREDLPPLDEWCYVMMLRVGCPRWIAERLWQERQEQAAAAAERRGNRGRS